MDEEEKISRLRLSFAKGVGAINFTRILQEFGSAVKVFKAKPDELNDRIGQNLASSVCAVCYEIDMEAELGKLRRKNVDFMVLGEEEYPKLLSEIYDPPTAIYYKGDKKLFSENSFSIVGTRKYSAIGSYLTRKFAGELSDNGFCIVSGMAFGIDAIAHKAVLERKGKTIAVLGSPIDRPSPASHFRLYEKIAEKGLVISEFPIGSEITAVGFPMRNRIISGLSLGTLIVEAPERSGALITAGCAIEHNREVFALPWNVNLTNGKGCNDLIKNGKAKLVENIADILEEFGYKFMDKKVDNESIIDKSRNNSELENKVLSVLVSEPKSTDQLSAELELDVSKVTTILSGLELKDSIFRDNDNLWKVIIN